MASLGIESNEILTWLRKLQGELKKIEEGKSLPQNAKGYANFLLRNFKRKSIFAVMDRYNINLTTVGDELMKELYNTVDSDSDSE